MNSNTTLAAWLARYFEEYMLQQRRVSRHTVLSYRDCWKLLLRYCCEQAGKPVDRLTVQDAGVGRVNGFLATLSDGRDNRPSTRNVRLAAIRSFFRWLAMVEPAHLDTCTRVLGIPKAKEETEELLYLERPELDALLNTIDCTTSQGVRDYALLALLYNTGGRVQEILSLRPCDVEICSPFIVRLFGKGKRERICVLWPETAAWIGRLLSIRGLAVDSTELLFVNRYGHPMTRHGVRYILRRAAAKGAESHPSLRRKAVHPHVLRHTAAMHMLQAGVDIISIQNILGHASSTTTSRYAKADLAMKRAALEKCRPLSDKEPAPAWRNDRGIMDFLKSL
jgi:site-specific recombinase XerD